MDEMIKKLSAYDLINILIPGWALAFTLKPCGYADITDDNLVSMIVISFILGVIASRVGSLVIEPIAIKFKLVRHDYEHYARAQAADDKLGTLTSVSNMYRMLAGAVVVLAVLALCASVLDEHRNCIYVCLGMASFLLFSAGWVKRERYVAHRVQIFGKDENVND